MVLGCIPPYTTQFQGLLVFPVLLVETGIMGHVGVHGNLLVVIMGVNGK